MALTTDLEFHHEQSRPNSCVAACICMVRARLGNKKKEARFHQGASQGGHSIEHATRFLGGKLEVLGEDDLDVVKSHLMGGGWAIVGVSGPRYVSRVQPIGHSMHGPMCPPGEWGGPFHAVVATGADAKLLRVLDPYHPKASQPVRIHNADFLYVWNGQILFVEGPTPAS